MNAFPPLTCLRSFEATSRLGSVTLAARELHVTHSAISQQIKVLEELVGLALFVREGRGLRVSEDGRLYALQIRKALGDIAASNNTKLVMMPLESSQVIGSIAGIGDIVKEVQNKMKG